MTTEDAKNYLSMRQIPQLFESLMTGLMYYRPDDHITYLQDCLHKLQSNGNDVRWNLFIQSRMKTPLPPIAGDNGSRSREASFARDDTMPPSLEEKRGSPLPPIGRTDSAAKPGMPNCPIVIFMGGPGSEKDQYCKRLVSKYPGWVNLSVENNGGVAAEDALRSLLKENANAPGILLEGFPRNLTQVKQYDEMVGRVDMVILVDYEEKYLLSKLDSSTENENLSYFKENTLPAIKHFDDKGKLVVIDGEKTQEAIFADISSLFDAKFYTPATPVPRPPSASKPRTPRPGSTRYGRRRASSVRGGDINVSSTDCGRQAGLPTCPLVFIMGGPGSGKNIICNRLTQRFTKSVHISMSELLKADTANAATLEIGDLVDSETTLAALLKALKDAGNPELILLDGYPRTQQEVDDFNKAIGGANKAFVLDCEEPHLRKSLPDNEATTKKINTYREITLPVISYYDDKEILTLVNVERSQTDVLSQIGNALAQDFTLTDYLKPIAVSCDDLGRVGGLPTCPIISIIGAPGSGHDVQCKRAADKYEFVHQPVTEKDTVSELVVKHSGAKGIILESYPCNSSQLEEFNANIGGLDGVVAIDVSEDFATKNAGSLSSMIVAFKSNTLPVLGHFDDKDRLKYVKGERSEDEIFADVTAAIDSILSRPKLAAKTLSYYKVKVADTGRKAGLPSGKIIAVIGAPKSKVDEFCKKATEKLTGSVLIQAVGLSADELLDKIKAADSAEVILLENFPAQNAQLEAFNEKIGGMSGVVVVDTTEDSEKANGADQDFIDRYKTLTVPMLCNYDDANKLRLIKGDQEEEKISEELIAAIEAFKAV